MKDKAEFAVNILLKYAKENGINGRDTTDLSPLESWLILRLYNIEGQLTIPDVSGLFEFSKFLNDNFEYFDNIEVGDVYKCKLGTGLYSEKEVYEKYLSSK